MTNKNKQLMTCILIGVLCVLVSLAGCKKKTEPAEPAAQPAKTIVDSIEQTTCPVMDGEINKELFTEYKGKKVYFCCPGCEGTFKADPEKYLGKLPQFK